MAARPKIMIVDNDAAVAGQLSRYLTKENCETMIEPQQDRVLDRVHLPDLILLDIHASTMDAYQLCRDVRAVSPVPIIILSDKGEVFDKVLGLEMGADDYLVKPYDHRELMARIRALLRRSSMSNRSTQTDKNTSISSAKKIVDYPDLRINLSNYSVTCDGMEMDMPPKEIELLYFLALSPNQVFTREQLLSHIWGYDYAGDTRTVDVHIKRLREKLKEHPHWAISTVWGVGYKFAVK